LALDFRVENTDRWLQQYLDVLEERSERDNTLIVGGPEVERRRQVLSRTLAGLSVLTETVPRRVPVWKTPVRQSPLGAWEMPISARRGAAEYATTGLKATPVSPEMDIHPRVGAEARLTACVRRHTDIPALHGLAGLGVIVCGAASV